MCVKLKPESMTNMHSGGGGVSLLGVLCGAVNNAPWGMSDAAVYSRGEFAACLFLGFGMHERVHL